MVLLSLRIMRPKLIVLNRPMRSPIVAAYGPISRLQLSMQWHIGLLMATTVVMVSDTLMEHRGAGSMANMCC